jgi:hypothetical protein
MAHWFEDNSLSIGHRPLVRIDRVVDHAPAAKGLAAAGQAA